MGVNKDHFCWALAVITGLGTGVVLNSFFLGLGFLIIPALGFVFKNQRWSIGLSLLPFVCFLLIPHRPTQLGIDLVFPCLMAAQMLVLSSRSGGAQAALIASGYLICLCAGARSSAFFLIITAFVFVSILFWIHNPKLSMGKAALGIFCLILGLGVPLFLLTPRIPLEQPLAKPETTLRRTAYAEEVVTAGVGGRVSDSSRIMKVRCYFEDDTPYLPKYKLYMRGIALDTYQNGCWTHSLGFKGASDLDDRELDGWTPCQPIEFQGNDMIYQDIELNPSNTASIFALPDLVSVSIIAGLIDSEGSAKFLEVPETGIQYTAISQILTQGFNDLEWILDSEHPLGYLQLPKKFESIARLAKDAVGDETSLIGKCIRIEAFLSSRCGYSIMGLPQSLKDPVEVFLFDHRYGCCADFASAMIVMLRTLKIPCRMASGFISSETGDVPHEFILRNEHAHAWVEVYFGPYGWVRFDPSPTTNATWTGSGSWFFSQYGAKERAKLIRMMTKGVKNLWPVVLSLSFILSLFILYRKRAPVSDRRPKCKADHFYKQFRKIVARAGVSRSPHTTPRELAQAAALILPAEPVHYITELFCAARYGNLQMGEEDFKGLKAALTQLKDQSAQASQCPQ